MHTLTVIWNRIARTEEKFIAEKDCDTEVQIQLDNLGER
jgi:hypothetical protein